MRAVVQRVTQAAVEVDGEVTGAIKHGLLVLLGVQRKDTKQDADYLARKIVGLRIVNDAAGKMNRSVIECEGALLVVSQFTLYGDCRKGMRPSFDQAAPPDTARELYEYFVTQLRGAGIRVETGVFQASMKESLVNDGPVTLICESGKLTPAE
jgi:D-tyrosyl-tRNA(Tyr) deacylase